MYSEELFLLEKLKDKPLASLSKEFRAYEFLVGFESFLGELLDIYGPRMLSESSLDPLFPNEWFSYHVEVVSKGEELDLNPLTLEKSSDSRSYIIGDIKKNKVNFIPSRIIKTTYLLALGMLDIENIGTLLIRGDEVGLPFDIIVSKERVFHKKPLLINQYAAYHFIRQVTDPDYVEHYVQRATQLAQLFADMCANSKMLKKPFIYGPVLTPSLSVTHSKGDAYDIVIEEYDLLPLVYRGLDELSIIFYFQFCFSSTHTEVGKLLETTMKNSKRMGH